MIVAITFQEAAHGWVAWRLGDDTAYRLGRVTFNPLRHIDLFGTIILPAALLLITQGHAMFGYAKPVPVNFARLHRPRRDMVLVAGAGPGINLTLALAAAFLIRLADQAPGAFGQWLGVNLAYVVFFNVVLAVFNMLPLPPLDDGRDLAVQRRHRVPDLGASTGPPLDDGGDKRVPQAAGGADRRASTGPPLDDGGDRIAAACAPLRLAALLQRGRRSMTAVRCRRSRIRWRSTPGLQRGRCSMTAVTQRRHRFGQRPLHPASTGPPLDARR